MKVAKYLDDHKVPYETIIHRSTVDSLRLAHETRTSGHKVAKSVLVQADKAMALVILPASKRINLARIKQILGAQQLRLAEEQEFTAVFKDCEVGALPPFGSQYGVLTMIDESLIRCDNLVFEGNEHKVAYRMKVNDYVKLEQPLVAAFSL